MERPYRLKLQKVLNLENDTSMRSLNKQAQLKHF